MSNRTSNGQNQVKGREKHKESGFVFGLRLWIKVREPGSTRKKKEKL